MWKLTFTAKGRKKLLQSGWLLELSTSNPTDMDARSARLYVPLQLGEIVEDDGESLYTLELVG